MSIQYFEPTDCIVTVKVSCQVCGKDDTIAAKESTPLLELECHICQDCKEDAADDHLTLDKFYDRVFAETGCHWPTAYVAIWWRDYLQQNYNGKAMSSYDFICALNLNDYPRQGIIPNEIKTSHPHI